ncbi:glycosyltransferase family 2 protein, partial [bacterium]|nr:glycosyltransferase family 2 protein [bacterium]
MESLTKFPSKKIGRDQRIKKVVKMNPSKSISEKSSTKPICSVIIPVFNGLHYTKDCINSVLNEKSRTPFEIIVVDAGSSDGVEKFLAECGEQIKLLSLPENLGFGHAVNFGSVAAEGDYIITLHSDTMPVPGWLDNMLSLAETDPNISIVGSKQLYPLHSLIQHSGIVFNSNHKPIFIYQGFPDDHSAVNKQREFPAVTDVCMLIRSEVFDDLSGFDDRFKNGFEDFDLCLRARFAGTKVVYQPQSVVYHYAESDERYYSLNTPNSKLFASIWNDRIKSDA